MRRARRSGPVAKREWCLREAHVRGVRALGALLRVVRDLRTLGEGTEAVPLDCREVDEEVLAPVLRRDEAEALLVAEPLDGSDGHCVVRLHGVGVLRTRRSGPIATLN